jgi:phosphatidylglycerophosphatase A
MLPPAEESVAGQVLKDPVHWLAFGFGVGLAPLAPGTWGSALAVVLYWLLVVLSLMFLAGIMICGVSARRLGMHDHGGIVWDEIVGMLCAAAFLPPEPLWLLAAFLAFRLFDIWKPWPIRDLDHRVSGGLGIMLDDVVAAAYAVLLTVPLQRFLAAS